MNNEPPKENNLPFPENNLPAATCNNDPNIGTRTSGFLQVVPPESAAPLPPQPVGPEEFPLTESPDLETKAALVALGQSQPPCEILETIDLGTLPWSKQPIREITPLVWFRYEKEDVAVPGRETFSIYNVIDGNGRNLFCVNEEGMANFFVNAANIYVHASLTNQV